MYVVATSYDGGCVSEAKIPFQMPIIRRPGFARCFAQPITAVRSWDMSRIYVGGDWRAILDFGHFTVCDKK